MIRTFRTQGPQKDLICHRCGKLIDRSKKYVTTPYGKKGKAWESVTYHIECYATVFKKPKL